MFLHPIARDVLAAIGAIFLVSVLWPFVFSTAAVVITGGGTIKWSAILIAGLLVPLWEETVFRVLPFWVAYRGQTGGENVVAHRLALLFASVGFALAHVLMGKPWYIALVSDTVVGFVLAQLYLWYDAERYDPRRAFVACVAAHGLYNIGRLAMAGPLSQLLS